MERGGMVHALEEIHRILKPTGILIDIHPVNEAMSVEVHHEGNIDLVSPWSVSQWRTDYQHADNALAKVVQRGLFIVERKIEFDSLTYYSSIEEMRTDLKEAVDKFAREDQPAGEVEPDFETLAARAEELMEKAAHGAELVARERAQISRLIPT